MRKGMYMRIFIKIHNLFNENFFQEECFYLLITPVNLATGIFLHLNEKFLLYWIASAIIGIKKKLMHIFDNNSLTVFDQTTSSFSLHYDLAMLDQTNPILFFCVCFTPCILLWGYLIQLPRDILLPLVFYWQYFSNQGIFKVELIPSHKHCNNTYYNHHSHSPDVLFILYDFLAIIWIFGLQKCQWVAHFLIYHVLHHHGYNNIMTLFHHWYLVFGSAPALVFFVWIAEVVKRIGPRKKSSCFQRALLIGFLHWFVFETVQSSMNKITPPLSLKKHD